MAENIRVTLIVDNREYIADLKAASNATKQLGKDAELGAKQAESAFNRLGNTTGFLNDKFTALKGLLLGAAFVGFARNAAMAADSVVDLSAATDISVAKIIELRNALQQSGGDAENAGRFITEFYKSIEEAAGGSDKAQQAFGKVGVSLQELATLSADQLFEQTLQGLAGIEDPATRAALAIQMFGKGMMGVSAQDLIAQLDKLRGKYDDQAQGAIEAARMIDEYNLAMANLQIAFLQTIAPLTQLINKMTENGTTIDELIPKLRALAVVVAALASAAGFLAIVRVVGMLGRGLGSLISMFQKVEEGVVKLGARIVKHFNPNGQVMRAVRAVAAVGGAIFGGVSAFLGFSEEEPAEGKPKAKPPSTGGVPRIIEPGAEAKRAAAEAKRADDEAKRRRQAVETIQRQAEAYRNNTEEARKNLQIGYDMIGMSDELVKVQEAGTRVTEAATKEIERLQEQRLRLTYEENSAEQIAAIDAAIEAIKAQTAADRAATEEIVRNGERRKLAYETEMSARKSVMDIVAGGLDFRKQFEQQRQLADAENELVRKKLEMQFEMERANQQALLELRKKYVGQEIPAVELAALEQVKAARQAELELNQRALQEDFDRRRTFIYGWTEAAKQAINSLQETVADQGAYAKRIFDTITGGFTNSIMKFVETGKLSFKDLFKSLMMEIIKMQMNKLFLSIFGKGGPLGSIFAGLFADGGYIPGGKYGIVGERGPELIRGPASVIGTDDTAAMLGGSGGITQVTYNISAVDSRSFKDLVASDPAFIYNVTRAGARRIPR
jgi:lambda family phage tail tape measure protein